MMTKQKSMENNHGYTLKGSIPQGLIITALICFFSIPLMSQDNKQLCSIKVITDPPGATVSCGNIIRYTTPTTILDIEHGLHLLIVKKQGYQEKRITVPLIEEENTIIELTLNPIQGLVLIHSNPSGVKVQINKVSRGKTPLFLSDLPLGKYRVSLSKQGYIPKEIDLRINDRIPVKTNISMTMNSATVFLKSEPQGSNVTLNSIPKGKTPCTLEQVPLNNSILELTMEGYYPYSHKLRLHPEQKENLTAILKPLPSSLTVVSIPLRARIYLNDQFKGNAPVTIDKLNAGDYSIRAELNGYEPTTKTITLNRGNKITEEFRLKINSGTFELTTDPAEANIFIDGKKIGTTEIDPKDNISAPFIVKLLSAEKHQVQVSKTGYFKKTFDIKIETGKTVFIHKLLKKRFIPNYEVTTATDTYKGVLTKIDPNGNIKIEIAEGVFKTIKANDIQSKKTIP